MNDMLEVQGALKLWADGKMSTVELFNKVGIVWDALHHDSLYSRLYKEIDNIKFRCVSVAEQMGGNKQLENECCARTAQAIASLIRHLNVREGL